MIKEIEIPTDRPVESSVPNKECPTATDSKSRETDEFSIFEEDLQCWDTKLKYRKN